MRKTKFQLSPQYELIENTEFLAAQGYNSTALLDKEQDEILLINPVIATFLTAFKQPSTLFEVVLLFQQGTDDSTKDIETALKPFFKSMRDRGILVSIKAVSEPQKPEMPNGEGTKMGNFTLQKRLTCVPPVDIYRATDDNGQNVLLKRLMFAPLFPEKYRPKIRRDFAQEFKILDILRGCPNTCRLIVFDAENEYAAIEFFEGDTLRECIKQNSLTYVDKIEIFSQILETATFMHKKKVLHGDWHYKNILIDADNKVRIIDFDLAIKLGQKDHNQAVRGGIKEFIPPERIDNSAFEVAATPPDFRSEVFQIGVVAYYLFFGDYPFKGETWKKLALAIQNDEPDWKKTILPKNVVQFLKKTLSKKPENRFNSGIEMFNDWQLLFGK